MDLDHHCPTGGLPRPRRTAPFSLLLSALTLSLALPLLPGGSGLARAEAGGYPSRPIRFIVPFGPGSGTDTSARYYARKLQDLAGQPVVVENRAGANGFIAVKQALSAPADGYTVFIGSNSTLAVNAALFRALPYDPVADFTPLSMMMRSPALLLVPAHSPYRSLADLTTAARAAPDAVNYGAGSAGYQLMAELFNEKAAVRTYHVPYKGAADALTAVASGTVQMTFAEVTSARELVNGERVRALAVAAERRVPALPTVPTASEAGLPGFTAYTWVAAMVPAKTPRAETAKLVQWMTQIGQMPETREFYERLGAEAMSGGPQQLQAFQREEILLWKRIATQAGVALQ